MAACIENESAARQYEQAFELGLKYSIKTGQELTVLEMLEVGFQGADQFFPLWYEEVTKPMDVCQNQSYIFGEFSD